MPVTCKHHIKSWGYNPFGENKEPTEEDIRKYKLYRCLTCGLWYSLISQETSE